MLVMKFVVLMVLLPVITFAIPAYSQKQIKMDVRGISGTGVKRIASAIRLLHFV